MYSQVFPSESFAEALARNSRPSLCSCRCCSAAARAPRKTPELLAAGVKMLITVKRLTIVVAE